jgi:hypothetical protein
MHLAGLTHAQLMSHSESRIEYVARGEGTTVQERVARRLVENTRLYRLWIAEHERLMRTVADESRMLRQLVALRSACFGLVHRKAMFEYLRQHRVTGRNRHAIFELIYGPQDYARAVVGEHNNYVKSVASLMCTTFVGGVVIEDRSFGEPMVRYEQRYADYFRTFCGSALESNRYNGDDTLSTLVPYLKQQLGKLRRAILALPREHEVNGLHNLEIRAPAANSQALSSGRVA